MGYPALRPEMSSLASQPSAATPHSGPPADPLSTALRLLSSGEASAAASILEALPTPCLLEWGPLHMLALARAHLGQYEAASSLYRRLAAADPSNPDALLQHGACLLAAGRSASAIAALAR